MSVTSTDRMDKVIDEAFKEIRDEIQQLQSRLAEVERERDEALAALDGFYALAMDSQGVAGFHLNGEISLWSEHSDLFDQEEALAALKRRVGAEAVKGVAKRLDKAFVRDWQHEHIDDDEWSQWCRVYGHLNAYAQRIESGEVEL